MANLADNPPTLPPLPPVLTVGFGDVVVVVTFAVVSLLAVVVVTLLLVAVLLLTTGLLMLIAVVATGAGVDSSLVGFGLTNTD